MKSKHEVEVELKIIDDEFQRELNLIHKHLGAFLKELEESKSDNCDDTEEFDALFDEDEMEKFVADYYEKLREKE